MSTQNYGAGIEVLAPVTSEFAPILTPEAVAFVARLHRACNARRL
jgi:malate synthase